MHDIIRRSRRGQGHRADCLAAGEARPRRAGRPLADPPNRPESRGQRGEVHVSGRSRRQGRRRSRRFRARHARDRSKRYRRGNGCRYHREDFRAFHPGGRVDHAALRRHRTRARDLPRSRRAHGGHGDRREPSQCRLDVSNVDCPLHSRPRRARRRRLRSPRGPYGSLPADRRLPNPSPANPRRSASRHAAARPKRAPVRMGIS